MAQRSLRDLDVTVAEQRRRQIIEAARATIEEQGAERTTLRNVARRAQVSHGTITYYFKSREAMVNAALMDATEDFLEQLRNNHRGASGPMALVDFTTRFLDPSNSTGAFVVELLDAGMHDGALQRAHLELMKLGGGWVEEAVRAGVDAGHFRGDIDTRLAAAAFHAALLWVGFQMRGGTVSHEHAVKVALQALELLKPAGPAQQGPVAPGTSGWKPQETSEAIRQVLLSDDKLSPDVATALALALESLYQLAVRASAPSSP